MMWLIKGTDQLGISHCVDMQALSAIKSRSNPDDSASDASMDTYPIERETCRADISNERAENPYSLGAQANIRYIHWSYATSIKSAVRTKVQPFTLRREEIMPHGFTKFKQLTHVDQE